MDMTLALLWLIGLFGFVLGLIIGHLWGATEPRHERTSWEAPEPRAWETEQQPEKTLLERQIDELMKGW